MSISGPAGKPRGRRAGPGSSPGTGPAAEQGPDDRAARTIPDAGARAGPPDDVAELQQEIGQTREELGQTVEQLVAKADVKARAQGKAAELAAQAKGQVGQVRAQAAAGAGSARDQLASKTAEASQKAKSAGTAVTGQVAAAAAPAWQAAPEPVRRALGHGVSQARQHRVPLAVAAGALVTGYLILRWWRKR